MEDDRNFLKDLMKAAVNGEGNKVQKVKKGCYRLASARLALGSYEDATVSAWERLNVKEGNTELETLVTQYIMKGRKQHLEKT